MTTNMCVHNVTDVSVASYFPRNNHSICLRIVHQDGTFDLTMYGLSRDAALTIVEGLDHKRGTLYSHEKNQPLTEYLSLVAVARNMGVSNPESGFD